MFPLGGRDYKVRRLDLELVKLSQISFNSVTGIGQIKLIKKSRSRKGEANALAAANNYFGQNSKP